MSLFLKKNWNRSGRRISRGTPLGGLATITEKEWGFLRRKNYLRDDGVVDSNVGIVEPTEEEVTEVEEPTEEEVTEVEEPTEEEVTEVEEPAEEEVTEVEEPTEEEVTEVEEPTEEEVTTEENGDDLRDPDEELTEMMQKLEVNETNFTDGDKPDTRVLSDILGRRISASKRDELWDKILKERGEG